MTTDFPARDIIEGGERADGSSLFPGMGISADASDVVLRPRLESAFLDPFAERPTLVVRSACARLEAGGVFPRDLIDAAIARLGLRRGS